MNNDTYFSEQFYTHIHLKKINDDLQNKTYFISLSGIRELLLLLSYIIFRKWILKWNLFYDLNVFNNLNTDFSPKKR